MAAAETAAGIEDKQRFNFGHAARIWPKTAAAATINRQNRHFVVIVETFAKKLVFLAFI